MITRSAKTNIVYPAPPRWMHDVPNRILWPAADADWTEQHRAWFTSRGKEVPDLLLINAERLRRRAKNSEAAAGALSRRPKPRGPVLPMLGDVSPMLRRHLARMERDARDLAARDDTA